MGKVDYTEENAMKCWCSTCPVQTQSACAQQLLRESKGIQGLPAPERLPGLYCATGKASCDDLETGHLCNCPACLIWGENSLTGNHYCVT